jgi:hypothetical protein
MFLGHCIGQSLHADQVHFDEGRTLAPIPRLAPVMITTFPAKDSLGLVGCIAS